MLCMLGLQLGWGLSPPLALRLVRWNVPVAGRSKGEAGLDVSEGDQWPMCGLNTEKTEAQ